MALLITDECISCGACLPECPNEAIFETRSDAETKGKLLQVIPRKDSKTGVTYWKLKDEKQDFYAFISPDKPDRLSIFAVDTNTAAAEGIHDAAKASDKPAADSEKS